MRRVFWSWAIIILLIGSVVAPAMAQSERRCFTGVPGITDCISGRFLEYWNANGGLAVFGYPLTPAFTENTADGVYLVQYFERQRFEYHADMARPYDVLLGRLGAEMYEASYGDWRNEREQTPTDNCIYFAETKHTICSHFLAYWQANGLRDPALDSFGRSLQLFGMPLTTPKYQRNPDGDFVLTQWFERARFEYHPTQPREFRVLLGRLGAELRQPGTDPDGEITGRDSALLQAINAERTQRGLGRLVLSEQLSRAAQAHSDDMAANNFFSHTGSDGSDVRERIGRTGYQPQAWGETLAAGYTTADEVVTGWLNSPGHRAIMLDPAYTELGIGVTDNPASAYTTYWTAVFAKR